MRNRMLSALPVKRNAMPESLPNDRSVPFFSGAPVYLPTGFVLLGAALRMQAECPVFPTRLHVRPALSLPSIHFRRCHWGMARCPHTPGAKAAGEGACPLTCQQSLWL